LLVLIPRTVRELPANIAASAAGERLRLVTEIPQDRVVPAAPPVRPAHQLEEESPLVLEHLRIGRGPVLAAALEQTAAQREIARTHQQESDRVLAVATGTADFLVVRLDRSGRIQMDDGPHVRPIDAHPEGVGADDDLELPVGELLLHARARGAGESGV